METFVKLSFKHAVTPKNLGKSKVFFLSFKRKKILFQQNHILDYPFLFKCNSFFLNVKRTFSVKGILSSILKQNSDTVTKVYSHSSQFEKKTGGEHSEITLSKLSKFNLTFVRKMLHSTSLFKCKSFSFIHFKSLFI